MFPLVLPVFSVGGWRRKEGLLYLQSDVWGADWLAGKGHRGGCCACLIPCPWETTAVILSRRLRFLLYHSITCPHPGGYSRPFNNHSGLRSQCSRPYSAKLCIEGEFILTCGLGGEKSTVNQAINLSLVDFSVKTSVHVLRNQIKSINKILSCVFAALFSTHVLVLCKPLLVCWMPPRRMERHK